MYDEEVKEEQRIECEYDHRLLLVVCPEGIITKCRTCKRSVVKTWDELKALGQQAGADKVYTVQTH